MEQNALALFKGKKTAGMSNNGVNYILTADAGGPLRSLELQIGAKQ